MVKCSSLAIHCVYVANRYIKKKVYVLFHITLRLHLNLNILIMLVLVLALLLVSQKPINYDCLDVVLSLNSTLGFTWTLLEFGKHTQGFPLSCLRVLKHSAVPVEPDHTGAMGS